MNSQRDAAERGVKLRPSEIKRERDCGVGILAWYCDGMKANIRGNGRQLDYFIFGGH